MNIEELRAKRAQIMQRLWDCVDKYEAHCNIDMIVELNRMIVQKQH